MLCSVIVPALNEERVIGECLEALCRRQLPPGSFEVVLADNGSTDATVPIARSFEGRLALRVIERKGVHISALRNAGAAAAQGEFLAFLDADCIPRPNWLAEALPLLEAEPNRIIGAFYSIPEPSTWVARAWYGDLRTLKQGPVMYVPAGSLLTSREAFVRAGGFDEALATSEDCEFCQRAAARGLPVLAIPGLSVVHLGTPQTLAAFYKKQRWHGSHVHKVFLRDPRHNAKSALFAFYMAAAFASVPAAALTGLLWSQWMPAALALAALLLPPAAFAVRGALKRRSLKMFPALAALYLVYGAARAASLFSSGGRRPARRPAAMAAANG